MHNVRGKNRVSAFTAYCLDSFTLSCNFCQQFADFRFFLVIFDVEFADETSNFIARGFGYVSFT